MNTRAITQISLIVLSLTTAIAPAKSSSQGFQPQARVTQSGGYLSAQSRRGVNLEALPSGFHLFREISSTTDPNKWYLVLEKRGNGIVGFRYKYRTDLSYCFRGTVNGRSITDAKSAKPIIGSLRETWEFYENINFDLNNFQKVSLENIQSDIDFQQRLYECRRLLAEAPTSAVNAWTDFFFYRLYPQMQGEKLEPSQTQLQQEWVAIRRAIADKIRWTPRDCEQPPESNGYDVVNYNPNEVADAVFYARHPELNGRKIRPGETNLAREWSGIQRRLPEFVCDNP
ncbi:hypothetical protein [Coleofasciculus sp. F4-SAH-05]|uniref:hypothetical protein n=1 Tax=Coleofasciculus sp. F4-SAH-05 TaxID=3069525 RepID=UPI0033007869